MNVQNTAVIDFEASQVSAELSNWDSSLRRNVNVLKALVVSWGSQEAGRSFLLLSAALFTTGGQGLF